jgi:hypothetical protein
MERRKRHTEHAEVSRSERLLQYNEKIGQAIVNMVLGSPESEAEDMTLLENGARQAHAETNQSKEPQASTHESRQKQNWQSGDKITAFTEFDFDRDYTMKEYQEIQAAFKQHRDISFPIVGGALRW